MRKKIRTIEKQIGYADFLWEGYREHQSGNRVVSKEIKSMSSPQKKIYIGYG